MQAAIAIVLTDAARNIQWVNHHFTDITGYGMYEVIGKKPSFLQGEDTHEKDVMRIREGLNSQNAIKDTLVNYTKEGKRYECAFVIHPIFGADGTLNHYLAFEADVSETEAMNSPLLQLKEKYATSSLKIDDQVEMYLRLCTVILEGKLYLNPELSLDDLAARMHTNTRYLSQVINTHSGFNMQHFINTHRIAAFKKLLQEGISGSHTLFGIAQKCGFKNKSTFYKVFKEIVGKKPKDYLRDEFVSSHLD